MGAGDRGNNSIIDFISKMVDYKGHQKCRGALLGLTWPQWSVYLETVVRESEQGHVEPDVGGLCQEPQASDGESRV